MINYREPSERQESADAMMTMPGNPRVADRLGFPWNLTDWIEPERLLRWINEEVEALDWEAPGLVEYLRTHPEYRPQVLMRLLTYAYATGVYASEDIAEQGLSDPTLRAISAPHAPRSTEVATFRRENRGLLKWCLEQVLKRSLRERFLVKEGPLPAGLRRQAVDAALTRIDLARHLDRAAQAE
jgi:hypothetical protein